MTPALVAVMVWIVAVPYTAPLRGLNEGKLPPLMGCPIFKVNLLIRRADFNLKGVSADSIGSKDGVGCGSASADRMSAV